MPREVIQDRTRFDVSHLQSKPHAGATNANGAENHLTEQDSLQQEHSDKSLVDHAEKVLVQEHSGKSLDDRFHEHVSANMVHDDYARDNQGKMNEQAGLVFFVDALKDEVLDTSLLNKVEDMSWSMMNNSNASGGDKQMAAFIETSVTESCCLDVNYARCLRTHGECGDHIPCPGKEGYDHRTMTTERCEDSALPSGYRKKTERCMYNYDCEDTHLAVKDEEYDTADVCSLRGRTKCR